jgi:hypothetical protein
MRILLLPIFEYNYGRYDGEEGISSMRESNQDDLNGEILAYLREIFPEPERTISRVNLTNYYSVDGLTDDIDNINLWYNTHLTNAIRERNFVADREWTIHINPDVYNDVPDHDEPFEAFNMYIDTIVGGLMVLNLDTEEGREDAMGYVNGKNNLYNITLPNVFAKKIERMGIEFSKSILNNSIFTEAFLPLTNFNRCQLQNVDFQRADLRYAQFYMANLNGANFKDANLTGANFSGANWQEAINIRDNPTFTIPPAQAQASLPNAVNLLPVPIVLHLLTFKTPIFNVNKTKYTL